MKSSRHVIKKARWKHLLHNIKMKSVLRLKKQKMLFSSLRTNKKKLHSYSKMLIFMVPGWQHFKLWFNVGTMRFFKGTFKTLDSWFAKLNLEKKKIFWQMTRFERAICLVLHMAIWQSMVSECPWRCSGFDKIGFVKRNSILSRVLVERRSFEVKLR